MKTFSLLIVSMLALLISSCSSNNEADRVAEKITNGEVLTQSDYGEIISYCGQYATKAQTVQDKIDNLPTNSPELKSLNTELSIIADKYPHRQQFFAVLESATPEEVGTENVKKIDTYGALTWFDTPSWASVELDPNVAGFVETAIPADSEIVAAPVLEEKTTTK